MSRKLQVIVAVLLTVIVGAIFYFSFGTRRVKSPEPEETVLQSPPETVVRHPLTGLPVDTAKEFFAVSVMLDNLSDVKSRPGLEFASIIYEALAEGGITRLMAVYDSSLEVKRFGPIRSVRPYFIDWATEYGGALMHVGGSPEALRQLSQSDFININEMSAQQIYFSRDASLPQPHNVFSSFTAWLKIAERLEIPQYDAMTWKYEEMEPGESLSEQQQIEIDYWSGNQVAWAYNKPRNNYVRFLNRDRDLFATGSQISIANLIVIEVPSRTIDAIGRQKMDTLGQGQAEIYRNGEMLEVRWLKETSSSRMRFLTEAQEEVVLVPGITWIQVVPSLEMVTHRVF